MLRAPRRDYGRCRRNAGPRRSGSSAVESELAVRVVRETSVETTLSARRTKEKNEQTNKQQKTQKTQKLTYMCLYIYMCKWKVREGGVL